MTENEAIQQIKKIYIDTNESDKCIALKMAISALGEIQKYREIGTVEECGEAKEKQIARKPNITRGQTDEDKLACCPNCDSNVDWTYEGFWRKGKCRYCHECGQLLDWSES